MIESQRREPWLNGPRKRQQDILNAAMEAIESVPYSVSLRWVFYRLYQKGFYKTKKDYENWCSLSSRARHTYWNGWNPAILADDTRRPIVRIGGYENKEKASENIPEELRSAAYLSIDHFYKQKNYVEIWFEARAMIGQFRHYTAAIDLVPMGGQPSIPYKWKIAENIEDKSLKYGKPIIVLYFGDEDLSGHLIKDTIELDVSTWCDSDFKIVWCGLTEEQAEKHEVPESVEKKGFQWEALSDQAAREIIQESVGKYLDYDLIYEADQEAEEINKELSEKIEKIIEEL